MLSNKGTFPLTCLVVLLVLPFIIPYGFAGDFKTELSVEDVSFANKGFDGHYDRVYHHDIQVELDRNTRVYVKFDKVVDYRTGNSQTPDDDVAAFADTGVFTHHDVVIDIYNKIGQVPTTLTGDNSVVIEPRYPNQHDGKNYQITFNTFDVGVGTDGGHRIEGSVRAYVDIKKGGVTAVDPAVAEADSKNAAASIAFDLVYGDGVSAQPNRQVSPTDDQNIVSFNKPGVYEISTTALRARVGVTEPFEVKIRLSEHPKAFTTDHIDVVEGKATEVVFLRSFNIYLVDPTAEYYVPTGRGPGHLHYEYLVTIEPKFENKNDIVIKVKEFEDLVKPNRRHPSAPYKYTPPTYENDYVEGFDKLTVKVGKEVLKDKTAGIEVALLNEGIIPKDGYLVVAKNRADSEVVFLRSFNIYLVDPTAEYYVPTGRGPGHLHYEYLVTIEPKFENKNDIVIKVKEFEDLVKPNRRHPSAPYKYTPPTYENDYVEGFDKLTVKVGKEVLKDKTAGIEVALLNEGIIPKDGYLVVAKNRADSAVRDPSGTADGDDPKEVPSTTNRQPFGRTYNIISGGLPNLEVLLSNGGTIDLVAPQKLIISEVMWGSDASLAAPVNSQYIEIRNVSGAQIKMGDGTHKLVFYGAGATLPDMSVAANNIQDRVGTVGASGYWSVAGIGQSGRTGVGETAADITAVVPTQELVSMQRGYEAATLIAGVASEKGTVLIGTTVSVASDGTMMSSWTASEAPGVNFDPNVVGIRIGSPGREPVSYPTTPTPEPDPTPVAEADDIAITEIMVDTSDGRLPQWIELTNVSGEEKSLAGWSLIVMNTAADDAAVGSRVTIDLSGTLGVGGGTDAGGTLGKSLLLVAWDGRNSRNLEGNDRVVDVSDQVDETGRYTLISETAFMLALMPPQKTSVVAYGDTAGNLGAAEAWEIPSSDGARSSLIRREMLADGMATMGTSANGWVLASSTSLVTGPATWYGSDEDAGTPGYDGGGPLPVELSHFRPARDKATGAVVITWSTQSELNNAGFFIKRSNQRDGQFEIINASMIPGAGTSSEKQFYTYTDTTAQPNVVYYYQIEDVSLDGNRQTLTNGIRLKGHIGAAGKLTTTWGDLKTQE